jgi:hypothetical protein
VPNLLPGISKLEAGPLPEDAGLQTILLAVNSSAGPISGQSELSFAIQSSNDQLIAGSAASVTRVGNHYAIQFGSQPDQFGQTEVTVGVTDRAGTTSTSVGIQVAPVNDAPRPRVGNVAIRLDDAKPVDSIALDTLFTDVDSEVLTYEITQSTLTHGSATIVDGRLVVAADEG